MNAKLGVRLGTYSVTISRIIGNRQYLVDDGMRMRWYRIALCEYIATRQGLMY